MKKWSADLTNFVTIKHPNIRQVLNPNYSDLKREIGEFNNEIEWGGMWTDVGARERLSNGWIFVGLFIDHQIRGWVWFNPINKFLYNLYVNKKYRNFYNAKNLVLTLMRICKENNIKTMYAESDDWNNNSQMVALKTGWILIEE